MHKILSPNISLVVAVIFLTQILPFGNAPLAFSASEPTIPPLALVFPSCQGKRPVEANGIYLARSEGWESLNQADSEKNRTAPSSNQDGWKPLFKEKSEEWAPIRNESPVNSPLTPSKSAEGFIGSSGGIVENDVLGVQVDIGPKSLTKSTRITISPVKAPQPFLEGPAPEGVRIMEGPTFDLGPSGLAFQKPVQVSVSPSEQFREDLKKGAELEVGYWNGKSWQPVLKCRSDNQGNVYFETDHFCLFKVLGVVVVGVPLAAAYWRLDEWKRPWQFITPNSPEVVRHAKGIRLPDPDRLNNILRTSLNLKSFVPRPGIIDPTGKTWWPRILVPSGKTMISRDDADCNGVTNYVASVLLAKKDPNFTDFICVAGNVTNNKGERGIHAWIEIKIKGKIYVVDTLNPRDICLIPKEIAYAKQHLEPSYQWTNAENSRKPYVGWGEKTGLTKPKPATDSGGYDWSYSGSAQDLEDYQTKQYTCNVTMVTDVPGVKVVKETAHGYNFLIPCTPTKQKYTFTISATVDKKPVTPIFNSNCGKSDEKDWNKNDFPYLCITEIMGDKTMEINLIFDHSTPRWQCTSGYLDFFAKDNMPCGRFFLSPDINQLK